MKISSAVNIAEQLSVCVYICLLIPQGSLFLLYNSTLIMSLWNDNLSFQKHSRTLFFPFLLQRCLYPFIHVCILLQNVATLVFHIFFLCFLLLPSSLFHKLYTFILLICAVHNCQLNFFFYVVNNEDYTVEERKKLKGCQYNNLISLYSLIHSLTHFFNDNKNKAG